MGLPVSGQPATLLEREREVERVGAALRGWIGRQACRW